MGFLNKLIMAAGLLLNLVAMVGATTCNNYDLETVYGSFENMHSVTVFEYAIDPYSFDMVVAGRI